MNWTVSLFRSSLGAKYLMALTGFIGYGFVIGHIAGNLLLFAGPDAMNSYGVSLREIPFGGLYIARAVLLLAVIVHIILAFRLKAQNRAARPVKYAKDSTRVASLSSRTMAITGSLILFYLVYHLAHFTWRVTAYDGPYVDYLGRDDVYTMVVTSFQQPLLSLIYIVGMLLVGFHLNHGAKSMFQTLGLNHPRYNPVIAVVPPAIGWFVALAGVAIPVAVLVGIIK
ncbi:MAG: succinate dehydrogenase cytochrome b subunit [Oligoflexus sp.]